MTTHHSSPSTLLGVALVVTIMLTSAPAQAAPSPRSQRSSAVSAARPYPVGTLNRAAPSGMSLPSPFALRGYHETYATTFSGTTLPAGWTLYAGAPGGDPGAMFARSHVVVGQGLLSINSWRDPGFANRWVTGGLCHCGVAGQTYGAYFVRSRMTGPGATGVELLWPDANVWPPEIDFNETHGTTGLTTATVHWGAADRQSSRATHIDMTQWHTWGVVWSATSVIFTVDGRVWGSLRVASRIPSIPLHLGLQSQTWCGVQGACPNTNSSMLIAWVSQYQAN